MSNNDLNPTNKELSEWLAESMKPHIEAAVKEAVKNLQEEAKTPAQKRADILAIPDRKTRQAAIKANLELFKGGA